jgi:hypothetical protein
VAPDSLRNDVRPLLLARLLRLRGAMEQELIEYEQEMLDLLNWIENTNQENNDADDQ